MRRLSLALSLVGLNPWLKSAGVRAAIVTALSIPACMAEAAINIVRLRSRLIAYPFMIEETMRANRATASRKTP
jgi:hypothetical protein